MSDRLLLFVDQFFESYQFTVQVVQLRGATGPNWNGPLKLLTLPLRANVLTE